MIGLKRGTVKLMSHQEEWEKNAKELIDTLNRILKNTAVDIQHIGSTAITSIHAKPIIDIVVGVRDLNDILPYIEVLKRQDIMYRGGDVAGQLLFVMGDLENDTRTHHIHVVQWNGTDWNNYLNFRDYLNACPEKARVYDECKQKLAMQFSGDRMGYTAGKGELIDSLLNEAREWRSQQ